MFLKKIDHPPSMKNGTRVLLRTHRNKDGVRGPFRSSRTVVTHNVREFDQEFAFLHKTALPNERIYVSASQRDVGKATRLFRERQLEAEYDVDPLLFYKTLHNRWVSCLSAKTSTVASDKMWLFDCDSPSELDEVRAEIDRLHASRVREYETKNGTHVLTRPFNRETLSETALACMDTNPMALWAYGETDAT